jgi:hypothetical protein
MKNSELRAGPAAAWLGLMSLPAEHLAILRTAASEGLPELWILEPGADAQAAIELLHAGLIECGNLNRPIAADETLFSPRITLAGREYLARLEAEAFARSSRGQLLALARRFQSWLIYALGLVSGVLLRWMTEEFLEGWTQ